MNASDYRRHRIQPTILPSVSGDASNTVADQLPQDLNPNNPQYYANTAHQSHPSSFLRPSRPGESANTLILPSQTHSLRHRPIQQHYHSGTDIFRPDNGSSSADTQLHLIDANLGSPVTPQVPNMGTSSIASGMRGNDDFQSLQFPDQQVLQQESTSIELQQPTGTSNKLLNSQKMVPNPPDLESWREKLFNVDGTITLTEGQFTTYFPHVDNVYSHRSTQHYKRKPFISHYWDCRLKGRAPGTPKSTDPNKKKRKRTARQRDLCDVKIKITEFFGSQGPGGEVVSPGTPGSVFPSDLLAGNLNSPFPSAEQQGVGLVGPSPALGEGQGRYFTIQRVDGNKVNGKCDESGRGGHRHTLEESDRVKKNSVQRALLKEARERKTAGTRTMSTQNQAQCQRKSYHKQPTGLAATTAANHAREMDLKLYGSCFCPFVQRVWIALELKGIPYQYIEVDPYQKPESLLEVNPRGLVPALRHGNWGCYESTVLVEYLEDLNIGAPLFPEDAKLRAHCRLWTDHVNRHVVPNFYRVLQEQDQHKQIENAQELQNRINQLLTAANSDGPFFLGPNISLVDVQVAPWILRLSRVLKPYRGWPDAEKGSRWAAWVDALEANQHIKATTSTDQLYMDSYERYAQNRPNTSQVANAINAGMGLP